MSRIGVIEGSKLISFAVLFCTIGAGCGAGKASMNGIVSYNGRPVNNGTLTLVAEDGSIESCPIGSDGSYSVTIRSGKLLVGVTTATPDGGNNPRGKSGRGSGREPVAPAKAEVLPKVDPKLVLVPPQYGNPDTSNVSITVKSGKQTVPIEIQD